MTVKNVRHLAGLAIKPLLGVMFVLGALMPAAPAGASVGGQPDESAHPYVGFLGASPIGRPDGPTGVLISPTVLLTAGHVTQSFAAQGLTHPRVTFEPVAGTASTWYTGTVHTNPAYDPRRADDPGDLGGRAAGVLQGPSCRSAGSPDTSASRRPRSTCTSPTSTI